MPIIAQFILPHLIFCFGAKAITPKRKKYVFKAKLDKFRSDKNNLMRSELVIGHAVNLTIY
jgi:hypothetical protein